MSKDDAKARLSAYLELSFIAGTCQKKIINSIGLEEVCIDKYKLLNKIQAKVDELEKVITSTLPA